MLTYTGATTKYGQLTNNNQSGNLSFGADFINQYVNEYLHAFPSIATERTDNSLQTLPGIEFYGLPKAVRKVNTVTVTVGNFKWPPSECPSLEYWNQLNLVNNIASDIPLWYFVYNNQIGFYPTPANGYNNITIRYQRFSF